MKYPKNVALVLAALLLTATSASAAAPLAATQLQLPASSNGMYQGYLPALSCPSQGNCVAGGTFNHTTNGQQGVLFTETRGAWQTGVPVLAPANAQNVQVLNVSCAAPGFCSADGTYNVPGNNQVTFVVSQTAGTWGSAHTVILPKGALGLSQLSQPHSIACASIGYCTVVGTYLSAGAGGQTLGFTVNEVHGRWLPATAVDLPPNKNVNPATTLSQVSCWAAGGCLAVGSYIDANQVTHAFTIASAGSVWRRAQTITMPPSRSGFEGATLGEVSCFAAASCTAIGTFNNVTGALVPMAVTMSQNVWSPAVAIALPANASKSAATFLWGYQGISCVTNGNCAFGGNYVTANGLHQGFLVNEIQGTWQPATALPLPTGALYAGANGGVIALSCTAAGTCTAAAAYVNAAKSYEAMLISEVQNHWAAPSLVTLPSPATTVGVDGGIYGLQCFHATSCQVTGTYVVNGTTYKAFALQS